MLIIKKRHGETHFYYRILISRIRRNCSQSLKKLLYLGFRATLNIRKFKVALNPREYAGNTHICFAPRGRGIVSFWKRTLQTPGMYPRDLLDIGQRYIAFNIPDELVDDMSELAAICMLFLGSGQTLVNVCSSSYRCTKPGT